MKPKILTFVFCVYFFSTVLQAQSVDKIQPMAANAPFLIEPYVFSIKGEKIAVAWSYDVRGPKEKIQLQLKHGGVTEILEPVLNNDLYTVDLPIPVCDFGSDVTYQVTEQAAPVKINEMPCPGRGGTTRFTFMADTQEGTEFAHKFAEQTKNYNGSAVIIGGDLVQTGSEFTEWSNFFAAMNPALSSQILVPGVGNHEYRYDKDVPLWKYFFKTDANDAYYSVNIGDAHIIALNSCFEDDPSMALKQISWLRTELAKPARWRIVFYHHPAYSKGIVNEEFYPKKEFLILQKNYLPLFEEFGVDLVLNGHTHIFERSLVKGIQYLTTGAAGGKLGLYGGKNPYSLKDERIRTMVELEVSANALRAVTTSIDGHTIDEFTLQKGTVSSPSLRITEGPPNQ